MLSNIKNMFKRKTILRVVAGFTLVSLLGLVGVAARVSYLMPALFRLNKECQEEGYYMAEFEFKMLGFGYQLDKGRYLDALSGLQQLHKQLRSKSGLVKIPKFSSTAEEIEFYLARQNPRTGAFMDDSFPYFTYDPPTQNVLRHLEELTKATGQPLHLRYPLRYLDEINTPHKVRPYLDDLSSIGWLASRLPQTSFVCARELLEGHCLDGGILERNNLYIFTPEWKYAVLQWFQTYQDPATGFWGPKSSGSGKLLKLDLDNTASIVKAFVDKNGNDIHVQFPLRYKPEMFATVLKVMSEPLPGEGDLGEWHEWALKMGKGTYLLTRYLWNNASEEHKTEAAHLMEKYIEIEYNRFFIPDEGAFSYYPGARHATLDGTSSGIGLFFELGAFSAERQGRLWGGPEKTCLALGQRPVPRLTKRDLAPILDLASVNSIRFYPHVPEGAAYVAGAAGVFYPRPTSVLDVVELVPRVRKWLETTSQSMGNWVSRQGLVDRLLKTGIQPVPISRQEIPLAQLDLVLKENRTLTMIAFDTLQVPRARITFRSE